MIRHTLIFRLHRPVDAEVTASFLDAVRAFAAEPPHAASPGIVREDLSLRPEGRSSSEGMLEIMFADADAFRDYLDHPRHVAFVADALVPFADWYSTQTAV